MTKREISEFEALQGQLESFHAELTGLAKKNPNDALNKFKLALVNALLQRANSFLAKSNRPFKDFEQFDEVAMPSNSDVLLVLSQYLSALEKLRADNVTNFRGWWYWNAEGEPTDKPTIRTFAPKKLKID
jgi:hypothetical protein